MACFSLPVVTVQPDFGQVIKDVDDGLVPVDKFWVSCYKSGEISVHAKVEVELDEVKRDQIRFRVEGGDIEFSGTKSEYKVGCKPLDIPETPLMLPVQDYKDNERTNPLRSHRLSAFDVAPDATRFAVGHLDGSVLIYPSSTIPFPSDSSFPQQINTSQKKLVSKPHHSEVTSLTFFPSSRVLLSTGIDFALSILPAEFPESWPESASGRGTGVQPVRVLRGHTGSVTSACILGLGRNVLSSSADSTLRLWDVPSGDLIRRFNASAPILCSSLGVRAPTPDGEALLAPAGTDEREAPEVVQARVFAGLRNGAFEVFDLRTQPSIYKSLPQTSAASISSISYLSSQYLLATGALDGVVTLYDVRSLSSPLTLFRRNEACITDMEFVPQTRNGYNHGLAIATADGLPYIATLSPENPGVQAELIGVDCDPVRGIRVRSGQKVEVWMASDDAIVRRYVL